jgi:hypothetical protein
MYLSLNLSSDRPFDLDLGLETPQDDTYSWCGSSKAWRVFH